MNEMMNVSYRVPAGRLDAFKAVVERSARKAEKLGVGTMAWKVVGETPAVMVRDGDWFGYVPFDAYRVSDGREVGASVLYDVEVTGAEPVLAGWRFVASLDHGEAGNVVNVVPGVDMPGLVAAWKDAPADCDHCRLTRNRLKTYVLADADGATKHVGSTCVGDYFPGLAADAMARLADLWSVVADAADDDGEEHYGRFGRFDGWRRETVLARAAAVVRSDGWLSKAKAEETGRYGASTADKVKDALTWRWSSGEPDEPYPVTDGDVERAAEVTAWVETLEPGPADDYLWNLVTAVGRPVTSYRLVGLVVSAVGAWERENVKAAERAAERWTDVPDDGKRRTVVGKVLSTRVEEGYYGTTKKALLMVETPDGNFKLWGSLPKAVHGAESGDVVTFAAVLKRSDRDANFGFWSRPTKAEFVSLAEDAEAKLAA